MLVGFGTGEQQARRLERLASGEVVASFALTEPGAGSAPAGLRTTARHDRGGWVIDGEKCFITNAPIAGLFVVFARTHPAGEDGTGIAAFLVPSDTPGVRVGPHDRKMGQEGAWTATVAFTDVRVPGTALVGGAGRPRARPRNRRTLRFRCGPADRPVRGETVLRDVAVERIYRDVRLLRLYEGTSEIQCLVIGGGLVRAARR
ncbi:hypothetical protein GCM10022222_75160 [Amycolatopsis ultiminotia]|uniref:Acyl-CoA dehydrogenase n=1 Tax=Amycolatopsis ultiminotia TaxID=543629 RepID=A0ABP6Y973_9PSEU